MLIDEKATRENRDARQRDGGSRKEHSLVPRISCQLTRRKKTHLLLLFHIIHIATTGDGSIFQSKQQKPFLLSSHTEETQKSPFNAFLGTYL